MHSFHREVSTAEGEAIMVEYPGTASVLLCTAVQYDAYQAHIPYDVTLSVHQEAPAYLLPPRAGDWHVVVELPIAISVHSVPAEEATGQRAVPARASE